MATIVTIEKKGNRPGEDSNLAVILRGSSIHPSRIQHDTVGMLRAGFTLGIRGAGIEPASSAHRLCSTVKLGATPQNKGQPSMALWRCQGQCSSACAVSVERHEIPPYGIPGSYNI